MTSETLQQARAQLVKEIAESPQRINAEYLSHVDSFIRRVEALALKEQR